MTLRGWSCGAVRASVPDDSLRCVRSACDARCWRLSAPGTGRAEGGPRRLRACRGPGVAGAGPEGWACAGQAAGGALAWYGKWVAATGRGSRCSRVAAGTMSLLLRVLTFLMVKRG